jgi:hypothetical protein
MLRSPTCVILSGTYLTLHYTALHCTTLHYTTIYGIGKAKSDAYLRSLWSGQPEEGTGWDVPCFSAARGNEKILCFDKFRCFLAVF